MVTEVFNHSWSEVVSGFWNKYPNVHSQHVLSEDVIEREILPNGNLRSVRLLSKTNTLPSWGKKIFNRQKKVVYIVEESIVDPKEEKMVVYSYNINYRNLMESQEKIIMTPFENTTQIVREGWIASSITGVGALVRNFGIQRWKSNAKKSNFGFLSSLRTVDDLLLVKASPVVVEKLLDVAQATIAKQKI